MHSGHTQNYNTYTQLQAVWKVHEKRISLVIFSKGNCVAFFCIYYVISELVQMP